MNRIFISYRRQDSEGYVGRLYDHLSQHIDRRDIFMDVDDIPPGADFVQVIEDAVAGCDVLLAVMGAAWLDAANEKGERRLDQWNDFVRLEIATALKQNKTVIPVLVGGARMPVPEELPDDLLPLARRNALELAHRSFAHDVKKLADAVFAHARAAAPPAISAKKAEPLNIALMEERQAALTTLRTRVINLTDSPLYPYRLEHNFLPVMGAGSLVARIMFIGEAPGKNEAEQGRPFIGPSGEVLDEMLATISLRREDVFVTNILKDRPPGQRDPSREEIAFYAPILDEEINIIQPQVIATLGRFSMEYILKKFDLPEKRGKISELHGRLLPTQADYGEIFVMPLFHPALVLYTASKKSVLRQDFQKLKTLFL